MPLPISVTLLTRNSRLYLRECLESLAEFDEVVVLDNGSTDDTMEIAATFPNVAIHRHPFNGFGPLRNLAAKLARNDWIFRLDSDEVATPGLVEEIRSLALDPRTVYDIPRENYYNRKLVTCCGWYPDSVLRLYNRSATSFDDKLVHENIVIGEGMSRARLKGFIRHYAYRNASELVRKMHQYAELWASENAGRKRGSPTKAISRAVGSFLKHYFLQRGFLHGYVGLLISGTNAAGVFFKYMMLYEAGRNAGTGD